jgi:16S rRNA G966 N2-methylase RsmD
MKVTRRPMYMASDAVGLYSATEWSVANAMTDIITQALRIYTNQVATESTIVDCTAGVGGNTLSFANGFRRVVSIEINKRRSTHLIQNVLHHHCTNVEIFNSNALHLLHTSVFENAHAVFIDPPWGGASYKYKQKVDLSVSGVCLCDVMRRLEKHTQHSRIVGVKAPCNFNISDFECGLGELSRIVNVCNLPKMLLIVVWINPENAGDGPMRDIS